MSQIQTGEVRSHRNAIVGAIFIAIALAFGWEATNYQLGTALRMGPGFIPLTLAVILALLGLGVLIPGLRSADRIVPSAIPWRGMALVVAALVIFGEFGQALGLVPVVLVCTFIVALASTRNSPASAALIAVSMSALCWLVFKIGLGITLPTFGSLFV